MVTDQRKDTNGEKECWLELLRIIAIVGVIFNHTDGFYLYYSNTDSKVTFFYSVLASVFCRMAVPLFLMVSGSVLLRKKESLEELYKKRIFRIVCVLFFTSAFYYILQIMRGRRTEYSLIDFARGLLAGNIQESLWYLYLYLGILLLLPVLRKLVIGLNRQEYKYFILLQCVFSVLLPVIESLTGLAVRSELYLFNLYLFYFLSGYWWSNEKKEADQNVYHREEKWCISFFLAAWIINIGIILEQHYVTGVYDQSLLDLMIPVMAQSFFVWIKSAEGIHPSSRKKRDIILRIGGCTFGIYLLEQLVRIQLLPMYLKLCMIVPGAVACSIYTAGTFSVALCYTMCLKKVRIIREFI